MSGDVSIERVAAEVTFPLRQRVLRPHETLAQLALPGDDDSGQKTFGKKSGDPLRLPGNAAGGTIPRSGTLPSGNIDIPGGPGRGGQPTTRNVGPRGDSKADGGRGSGRSGGRDEGGGNNSPPPGAKGKNRDKS